MPDPLRHIRHRERPLYSRWKDTYRKPPAPPAPAADLVVTGSPTPDCRGDYVADGTWDGETSYRRTDSTYWIWYYAAALFWVLSTARGDTGAPAWAREYTLLGDYVAQPGASGVATVAEP